MTGCLVIPPLSDGLPARFYLRRQFGEDIMSMSIPWQMFLTMEEHVAGSFLERNTWRELMKTKESGLGSPR